MISNQQVHKHVPNQCNLLFESSKNIRTVFCCPEDDGFVILSLWHCFQNNNQVRPTPTKVNWFLLKFIEVNHSAFKGRNWALINACLHSAEAPRQWSQLQSHQLLHCARECAPPTDPLRSSAAVLTLTLGDTSGSWPSTKHAHADLQRAASQLPDAGELAWHLEFSNHHQQPSTARTCPAQFT